MQWWKATGFQFNQDCAIKLEVYWSKATLDRIKFVGQRLFVNLDFVEQGTKKLNSMKRLCKQRKQDCIMPNRRVTVWLGLSVRKKGGVMECFPHLTYHDDLCSDSWSDHQK